MATIYGKDTDKSCYQRPRVTRKAGAIDRNGESCQQGGYPAIAKFFGWTGRATPGARPEAR
jgi:hypothetical protein